MSRNPSVITDQVRQKGGNQPEKRPHRHTLVDTELTLSLS